VSIIAESFNSSDQLRTHLVICRAYDLSWKYFKVWVTLSTNLTRRLTFDAYTSVTLSTHQMYDNIGLVELTVRLASIRPCDPRIL